MRELYSMTSQFPSSASLWLQKPASVCAKTHSATVVPSHSTVLWSDFRREALIKGTCATTQTPRSDQDRSASPGESKSCQAFYRVSQALTQHHFCHILLVKTRHNSKRFRERRNRSHLPMGRIACMHRKGRNFWTPCLETLYNPLGYIFTLYFTSLKVFS